MIEPKSGPIPTASPRADPHWPEGEGLRRALAQGDKALGRIGPILGHLLSTRDQSLFSDELVARSLPDAPCPAKSTLSSCSGTRGVSLH